MITKGLNIQINDSATGAPANFHVIEYYSIDIKAKHSTARVAGYVSEQAFDLKKSSLISVNITIPGLPAEEVNTLEWFYDQISKPVDPGKNPGGPASVQNVFAGAQKIEMVAKLDTDNPMP